MRHAVRLALLLLAAAWAPRALAQTFTIAVHSSLTGGSRVAGQAFLEAVRFAVDEAAAAGGPRFELAVLDDASTSDGAHAAARAIIAGDAALVLGPARTPLAIDVAPDYGAAGLPMIATTLHADALTTNPTTFRTVISTGEIGAALADYLGRVLRQRRAIVFSVDNGYGRPLAEQFRQSAERQGIATTFHSFATQAEREAITRTLGGLADPPPIVLGMEYEDAAPTLMALRRLGYRGLVMGTATMARANFAGLFANEPEERITRGAFTDGVYAASPMILDSANAAILDFANRFQARFHHEPSWEAVQAYDGALLAMAALRRALAAHPDLATAPIADRRQAVLAAIRSFDAPTTALAGLNGPIWFTPDRIRRQPVRIGRFHAGAFESAPLQIVPVADPDPDEVALGAVFETEPGRFNRLQRVVQTGTFTNLIPRVDIAKSTFGADFYLWMRYARDAGPGAADPVDIGFPNMVSGRFNAANPAETTQMADGTEYRLWRVQGEFRTEFDLRRFPFDRQSLQLRFFNARASSDRIVYVIDRRSAAPSAPSGGPAAPVRLAAVGPASAGLGAVVSATAAEPAEPRGDASLISPRAFSDLTQWEALGAHERRDTLVTPSALGDLRRVGLTTPRELSGFLVTFELRRHTATVLVKLLLPMLLMGVVMYSTLHFPHALTKEKVTVAVTAALSGAVLLSAVNNQLGAVGYTITAEYAFYAFFALGLLCVVYVMAFETLRLGGHEAAARRVEHATRAIFILAVLGVIAAGLALSQAE
jgi:branched-chain amino acid transport system substrate-binding protein